ncbi:hypothetical protein PV04_08053 [Phialophora macrospora]|uniref:Uncharacterized protein n=1 Tax=Phialophora macrospora TaxID=1851006 RepID=A0A0D2DUP9_9EURO|nr:hypothetical protein PV04_08053 [Phialophora macrospora]
MPTVHLSAPSEGHRGSGPSSGHGRSSGSSPQHVPAKEPAASETQLPAHEPVSHPALAQPTDHPSSDQPKPSKPYPTGGIPKPKTHPDVTDEHPHPPKSIPAKDPEPHAPKQQPDSHVPDPTKLGPSDVGMHGPTSPQHPSALSADSDIPQGQVHGPTSAPDDHDPDTPTPTHTGPGASAPPDTHSPDPASQGPTFILHSEPPPRPSVADHFKDIGWDMAGSLATGVIGAGLDIGARAVEDQIDQNYLDANQDQHQDQDEGEGEGQGQDPVNDTDQPNQAVLPVQHAVVTHPTYPTGDQPDYDDSGHGDAQDPEDWGVYDDYYADGGLDGELKYDDPYYFPGDGITSDPYYDHCGYSEHDQLDPNGGYGDPSADAAVGHGTGAMNQAYEVGQHA